MIRPVREAAKARRKRVIVVCASQMSKSETWLNLAGARLQDDPVPVLWIGPTKSNVEKVIEKRFMQMVRSCAALEQLFVGGKRSSKHLKQIGPVTFRLAWAGSATELASDPAGLVIVDERDRMDDDVAGEGDPVVMADARHATYADGLTVVTSSPKTGTVETYVDPASGLERWAESDPKDLGSPIWKLWQEGSRHEWAWPCPDCGEYFIPRFRLLAWPKDSTPQRAKRDARMACPHCGVLIGDESKTEMNARGVYVAPGQSVLKDGSIEGEEPANDVFSAWVSGLCSPWVSFGQRAQAFLAAVRSGDRTKVQAVLNTGFGELYSVTGDAPSWEKVWSLRRPYQLRAVPDGGAVLFMAVDVQKRSLVYTVRAWGPGSTSWLVDRGELHGETEHDAVWADLARFRDVKYGELGIHACFLDTGYRPGDKWKRPDNQIYQFARRFIGWAFATKSHDKQDKPIKPSVIDISVNGQVMKNGLTLWHLDSDHFKSWVFQRLEWPAGQPGGWFVPDDIDEDYCRQIVSEARVTKPSGHFVWLRVRRANHFLDCEMMQAAAAYHFKVWTLKAIDAAKDKPPPAPPKSDYWRGRETFWSR